MAPNAAKALAGKLEERGLVMLDTPVSGGQPAARAGTMTVMGSGSPQGFDKAKPVLDAIGGKIWRLGDAVGVGSTVKMVDQLLAGVHIATAAEAMALGIRAGADPQALYDVIVTAAGNSWMFQNRVPHILSGDDKALSAINIFVKDLGIVLDQARALSFPLPLAATAHQLFLAEAGGGHGGSDDAFVIRYWQHSDRHQAAGEEARLVSRDPDARSDARGRVRPAGGCARPPPPPGGGARCAAACGRARPGRRPSAGGRHPAPARHARRGAGAAAAQGASGAGHARAAAGRGGAAAARQPPARGGGDRGRAGPGETGWRRSRPW